MAVFKLDNNNYRFPSPSLAEEDGLLAFGGDLNPQRLIIAYAKGIFPWYSEGMEILWWSLDPRMVLYPEKFILSKNLKRKVNKNIFSVRFDTNFCSVINQCRNTIRKGEADSWITDSMKDAYIQLHRLGLAHSVETFFGNELVGGLYGVSIGKVFYGESMFYKMTDASKVALYYLVKFLQKHQYRLIDCQMSTNHLRSLGAIEIPRKDFIKLLKENVTKPTLKGFWPDCYIETNLFEHC